MPINNSQTNSKTVFVTVGTTLFDPLIEAICTPSFLHKLISHGYTHVIIQYGKGSIPNIVTAALPNSNSEKKTIPVEDKSQSQSILQGFYPTTNDTSLGIHWQVYPFKPSLEQDMKNADLILSHAGAGSIMEGLSQCHSRNTSTKTTMNTTMNTTMDTTHNSTHNNDKKMVVVINDELMDNHQMELAEALAKRGYLMMLTGPIILLENDCRVMGDIASFQPRDFLGGDAASFGTLLDSFMGFAKTV
jgi:beta-1,4-N-acetylglucosaminyltransferase